MDLKLLKASAIAFSIAFIPPILSEIFFQGNSLFLFIWTLIPVAFHEIGHLFFLAFGNATPMHYLGGFLFNGIAGLLLLAFSLHAISRIKAGKLRAKAKPMAYSFLFISYLNLFLVPYTLTHLQHVVGQGLDFTVASSLLGISLQELLFPLWVYCGIVLAAAAAVNAFFVFRNR